MRRLLTGSHSSYAHGQPRNEIFTWRSVHLASLFSSAVPSAVSSPGSPGSPAAVAGSPLDSVALASASAASASGSFSSTTTAWYHDFAVSTTSTSRPTASLLRHTASRASNSARCRASSAAFSGSSSASAAAAAASVAASGAAVVGCSASRGVRRSSSTLSHCVAPSSTKLRFTSVLVGDSSKTLALMSDPPRFMLMVSPAFIHGAVPVAAASLSESLSYLGGGGGTQSWPWFA